MAAAAFPARTLELLRLLPMSDLDTEAEILALRHEDPVLDRTLILNPALLL